MAKTIYDVARAAGVSHTSVSAVLNNKPIRMRDATRQRILDAALDLGYQVNRVAQQLSTGRFDTIGLYFAASGSHVFANWNMNQLVAGIVHGASEKLVSVLFAPTKRRGTFEEAIAKLPSQGLDGAVVIGPFPFSPTMSGAIGSCGVPLICVDSQPALSTASTVDADNFLGMKMGIDYLISNGHKKMVYIGPVPEYQCLSERMRGFYESIQEAGISLAEQETHVLPSDSVADVVRQVVEARNGCTALICAEESIGRKALDELLRLGLKIPGDLTVLIYDDVLWHPLTNSCNVIRNDFFAMGVAAVEALVRLINKECSGPLTVRIPPELVSRTP